MIIDIELNKNPYGIEIDGSNYTAIAYGVVRNADSPKFGEKTRKELGYYSNLANAAIRLLREEISTDDSRVSLNEFVTKYQALTDEIKGQFDKLKL